MQAVAGRQPPARRAERAHEFALEQIDLLVDDALGRRDARAVLAVKDHIVARFPRDAPWTLFRRHLLADVEAFGGEFPDDLVMSVERSYQMQEVDEDEVDEDE